jgi:hypothetical protein
MKNKIFHLDLSPGFGGDYDSYSDFVIIAENETRAREMCHCGDECGEHFSDNEKHKKNCVWKDSKKSFCRILGETDLEEEMVCESFHAG